MATLDVKKKRVGARKPVPIYTLRPGTVVVALDVSSSAMGWAVGKIVRGSTPVILDFGVVRPPSGWDFQRKVFNMMTAFNHVVEEYDASNVCMEWQSHKTTFKRVQGLAVLGQAQGAVWGHAVVKCRVVDRISEREWTRIGGRNASKEDRCAIVKATVPAYAARLKANPKFDPGMDAADAIGLLIYRASVGLPLVQEA